MARSLDQFARNVFDGRNRSLAAGTLRVVTRIAETPYAGLMNLRNTLYDRRLLAAHALGRPTVSIGNLTAGGTGKTPVVRWLADAMRQGGRHPAILLRGYMRQRDAGSDEAAMLRWVLNRPGLEAIEVEPNPDRLVGARAVLARSPQTDRFILDDAFQHRRARRDFDLVLINAAEPFGFNHVHPRGLLREPLRGLRRADAVLLTHTDSVGPTVLEDIRRTLGRWNSRAPIFQCVHHHAGLWDEEKSAILPMEILAANRFIAFAGIGHPEHLERQLRKFGDSYAAGRWFADHHAYSERDVRALVDQAQAADVRMLVTTAKDWIKLRQWRALWQDTEITVLPLELAIAFDGEDEIGLLEMIQQRLDHPSHV